VKPWIKQTYAAILGKNVNPEEIKVFRYKNYSNNAEENEKYWGKRIANAKWIDGARLKDMLKIL
jgi:hypothetical protein